MENGSFRHKCDHWINTMVQNTSKCCHLKQKLFDILQLIQEISDFQEIIKFAESTF